jgi:hypothetical protein
MDLFDLVQNITGFSDKHVNRALEEEYALALINAEKARRKIPQSKVISIFLLIQKSSDRIKRALDDALEEVTESLSTEPDE